MFSSYGHILLMNFCLCAWFLGLVCYAATQLATQLQQRCIQVVRSMEGSALDMSFFSLPPVPTTSPFVSGFRGQFVGEATRSMERGARSLDRDATSRNALSKPGSYENIEQLSADLIAVGNQVRDESLTTAKSRDEHASTKKSTRGRSPAASLHLWQKVCLCIVFIFASPVRIHTFPVCCCSCRFFVDSVRWNAGCQDSV